ncbi:malto-oligosyltrehalose trehalohydrolase [Vulgatibacter incomptus]|uniref:Malto-oligosyltrehalose trehalohydrolase n=1 Tax=Vulgatibacter incomptus TaxID=1391653 RepID=A0A0K1P855_9BACT|nr:malto-oligosyltrehalose trehalohydrolase [Vulgatibacter incomptus]AKU89692.1 Malto-oligosyltrehalose trehalohydrolase [Vulgatibacter incomptus]
MGSARTWALGANPLPEGGWSFGVWAPRVASLALELLPRKRGGSTRRIELQRVGDLYVAEVDGVADGDRYFFVCPDGRRRPDPRSRRQPEGVHGPSAVVDVRRFRPSSRPRLGRPADWVIYELHVGTFTPEGTFDGVAAHLGYLRDELGVDAIEVMPVASFPGTRNWGYDGVHPFAVQESYGGPAGLARLVGAAHEHGLAVILDVVYNHLGPEGNYLREFGPYFTKKHHTPWGEALNFDDAGSGPVRAYFVDNAVQWIRDFGIDALRLDAIQMIRDSGPRHVLSEIGEAVQAHGGAVISESDLNDPLTVLPRPEGWGHDAQWSDDLHHALHAILTRETTGYYADYGKASDVATALERGFVYDGSRFSGFRGKAYGRSSRGMPSEAHVVCLQNHDQVGNRARGDRLVSLVGPEAAKAAAAVLLLAPEVPLLFMGEEYAAPQPFPFFTSHSDPALARAVTEGRRHEFAAFEWQGEVPDPQAEETMETAILRLEQRAAGPHGGMLALYRTLLAVRRDHPALRGPDRGARNRVQALDGEKVVVLERWSDDGSRRVAVIASLGRTKVTATVPLSPGRWTCLIDTRSPDFGWTEGEAPGQLEVGSSGEVRLALPPSCAWIFERS